MTEPEDMGGDPITPPAQYVDPPAADPTPPAATPDGNPPPADPAPAEFNLEEYLKGVTVDEGKDYTFDQDLLKEVAPVANELGIKPEALGKLANLIATRQSADMAKAAEERAAYNARQAQYVKRLDAEADVLRKENPQFDTNVKAALALPFLKGSEFLEVLTNTHLLHDPRVLQLLERAGRTASTDEGIGVNTTASTKGKGLSFAEIMSGGLYK